MKQANNDVHESKRILMCFSNKKCYVIVKTLFANIAKMSLKSGADSAFSSEFPRLRQNCIS